MKSLGKDVEINDFNQFACNWHQACLKKFEWKLSHEQFWQTEKDKPWRISDINLSYAEEISVVSRNWPRLMIEYNITVLWPCFIFGLLRIWWIKLILRQLELMKSIGSTRKISDHSFPLILSIYIDLKQLQQGIMKLTLNWNIELVRSWFHSKVYGSNVPQPFILV